MKIHAALLTLAFMSGQAVTAPLADPTRPPSYSGDVPREVVTDEGGEDVSWNVTAITIAPSGRRAIVNGQMVTPGATLGPATVLEILPTSVVLDQSGERVTVDLVQQVVKTPAGKAAAEGKR
ncbi:MAG: general secretion pathway protein GspB [Gammaproteobacteria bacterium]|nr:general secretion pathway protein GspB [Gammaproteobacteria bacterium]MCI0590118.1 general secretion pathway protein GspB [Gammaproteobacteria bacterium]